MSLELCSSCKSRFVKQGEQCPWCLQHSKEGYTVETIRYGQPRAYADTDNEYIVSSNADKTDDEVLAYCRKNVCEADMQPVGEARKRGYWALSMHVRKFSRIGPNKWRYHCGHHYTG